MGLSGKFRFRKSSFGVLVLQVEDVQKSWWSSSEKPKWRDAKPIDLAATEFRQLIDLGNGRPMVPLSRAAIAVVKDTRTSSDELSVLEQREPSSVGVH